MAGCSATAGRRWVQPIAGLVGAALVSACLGGNGNGAANGATTGCATPSAAVTIDRDRWGVPHIHGATLADAVYGHGYAQAADRLLQIDLLRRTGRGRRAELLGAGELDMDRLVRTIGLERAARASLDRIAADRPDILCLVDAYAGGVNAYIDDMQGGANGARRSAALDALDPAYVPPPWERIDVVVVATAAAFSLSSNIETDLTVTAAELLVDEAVLNRLLQWRPVAPVFTLDDPADDAPLTLTAAAGHAPAGAPPASPDGNGKSVDFSVNTPCERGICDDVRFVAAAPTAPTARAFARLIGLFRRLHGLTGPRASNNWAVAGDATADGRPILASDPHGSITIPPSFHEVHLMVDDPALNMYGIAVAGGPMVHFGHNGRAGWAFTNYGADVGDLYFETLADGGDAVEFRGGTVALTTVTEAIAVRPAGGPVAAAADEPLDVRIVPHHGPILNDVLPDPLPALFTSQPISYRWAGAGDTREAVALASLGTIADWDDFLQAMRFWEVGAQNGVFAGAGGDIGYIAPGLFPVRPWDTNAHPPIAPLPGDGTAEWNGFTPFSELPRQYNPAWGFVASANNDPMGLTADGNPFGADYLGFNYAMGTRIQRIRSFLTEAIAAGTVTLGTMAELQTDVRVGVGEILVPRLLAAATAPAGVTAGDIGGIRAALAGWDYHATTDSAGAAAFHQVVVRLVNDYVAKPVLAPLRPLLVGNTQIAVRALVHGIADADAFLFPDGPDAAIAAAMAAAQADLKAFFGSADPADWAWGPMHVRTWEHPLGGDFNRGPMPVPGGLAVVNRADVGMVGEEGPPKLPYEVVDGPDMRMLAALDGPATETWIQLPAGASGDPSSPHYDDQLAGWVAGRYRRAAYTPAAVAEASVERVVLAAP